MFIIAIKDLTKQSIHDCIDNSGMITKDDIIEYFEQGISEPIFYGDLVFKFKRIVGKPYSNDQFKKITKCYKKKMDITWISCDSLYAWL